MNADQKARFNAFFNASEAFAAAACNYYVPHNNAIDIWEPPRIHEHLDGDALPVPNDLLNQYLIHLKSFTPSTLCRIIDGKHALLDKIEHQRGRLAIERNVLNNLPPGNAEIAQRNSNIATLVASLTAYGQMRYLHDLGLLFFTHGVHNVIGLFELSFSAANDAITDFVYYVIDGVVPPDAALPRPNILGWAGRGKKFPTPTVPIPILPTQDPSRVATFDSFYKDANLEKENMRLTTHVELQTETNHELDAVLSDRTNYGTNVDPIILQLVKSNRFSLSKHIWNTQFGMTYLTAFQRREVNSSRYNKQRTALILTTNFHATHPRDPPSFEADKPMYSYVYDPFTAANANWVYLHDRQLSKQEVRILRNFLGDYFDTFEYICMKTRYFLSSTNLPVGGVVLTTPQKRARLERLLRIWERFKLRTKLMLDLFFKGGIFQVTEVWKLYAYKSLAFVYRKVNLIIEFLHEFELAYNTNKWWHEDLNLDRGRIVGLNVYKLMKAAYKVLREIILSTDLSLKMPHQLWPILRDILFDVYRFVVDLVRTDENWEYPAAPPNAAFAVRMNPVAFNNLPALRYNPADWQYIWTDDELSENQKINLFKGIPAPANILINSGLRILNPQQPGFLMNIPLFI